MKNKILLTVVVAITAVFTSCKNEPWPVSDIKLVPVYSITNIQGQVSTYILNVYREKPLLVENLNSSSLVKYTTVDYVDNSTETDFAVTFSVPKETKNDVVIQTKIDYNISASKATGIGVIVITKYNTDDTLLQTISLTMKLTQIEKYN